MEVIILRDSDEIGSVAADAIETLLTEKPDAVLGLATGSSPLTIYDELAARCKDGRVSLRRAKGFTLDEYVGLPAEHPEGWPAIRSNERGVSRFVYGFMLDTLRRVSEHVTIGSAARKGVDLGSWFVLCREA